MEQKIRMFAMEQKIKMFAMEQKNVLGTELWY